LILAIQYPVIQDVNQNWDGLTILLDQVAIVQHPPPKNLICCFQNEIFQGRRVPHGFPWSDPELPVTVKITDGKVCDKDEGWDADAGTSDTYVKVWLQAANEDWDMYCGQTKTIDNDERLEWNQEFDCGSVPYSKWGDGIKVYMVVKDKDKDSGDDQMAEGSDERLWKWGESGSGKLDRTGGACSVFVKYEVSTPDNIPPPGEDIVPPGLPPASFGDPHFRAWNGVQYDFHGGCDLVLLHNPNFFNGLGLSIHVRTKIKNTWSFIESAAVQLGDNILEIKGGKGDKPMLYWLDGETEGHEIQTGDAALGDFPIHFLRVRDHQSKVRIGLGSTDAISIETFNDFVRVNLKPVTPQKWVGSAGLLGTYPTGQHTARDGVTILEDANEFGQEWQVKPNEAKLFHDREGVGTPLTCEMPDESAKKDARRRLGETAISEEEAAAACLHVSEAERDACIFDVLAINDKGAAGAY
jgi:C2 domain